jgi:CheY-like chemotaxis protein
MVLPMRINTIFSGLIYIFLITVHWRINIKIFCESLLSLINDPDEFEVIWVFHDGEEAIEKLSEDRLPQILLLDINM